jgi:glutathione S-transferase
MAKELVFYTHPMSRGRIARWMLEEVGQPYRTEILDYATTLKAPAYLAINPMGKIPAITHGGQVVTEAAAICAYLADAFPDAGLAPPAQDAARGAYYRGLFFAAGPLEAAITNTAAGFQAKPEQARMMGYGTLAATIDTLEMLVEQALAGGGHLAGSAFSAADLYVGAQIGWGLQFGTIEKRPAFERYVAALTARPAYARAVAIDDKALAAMQGTPP